MKFNIKAIRQQCNMSQKELSRKSGVPRATICGMETGRTEDVTTKTLQALSEALGVPVPDLFLP